MKVRQRPDSSQGWDAIVIGSGVGGLSTAALLASIGKKRVLVLERHSVAGGYTHVFQRRGYEWDVGLHYVGEVHDKKGIVRKIFDHITDGQLQWAPLPDVYDRIIIGTESYDFVSGTDRFRRQLKTYFPEDSKAIDQYFAAVRSVRKASTAFFAEKAIPRLFAFPGRGLMRRRFLHWADRTTAEVLDRFTQNKKLKGVLTGQWGNYGLTPAESSFGIHALIAGHYFEGANYPVGGASRVAQTIAPTIERAGGQIMVNADVAEVITEGKKAVGVRLQDNREFRAPIVISDIGARNTFRLLLSRLSEVSGRFAQEIKEVCPSTGHLCLYVGVKESASRLGINGSNIWIHPSYDHDADQQQFLADPKAQFSMFYISFPSAKDPDFERRHPGRATVEVVTPVPAKWFERWQNTVWKRRGEDYDAFKQELLERMQTELVRRVPVLAGKIDYAELSTPVTTRHFMNHQSGEIYGLNATPERFRLRCLTPHTPIRNFYLTGQDVGTLGITGALFGSLVTSSAILGRNVLSWLQSSGQCGS